MIIGLTGGIASGKSTVSNMLREKGFPIIDADIAARAVVEPGQPALQEIADLFGHDVLISNGSLNREKLGSIIFYDETKRKQLNEIIHPAVRAWMMAERDKAIEKGYKTIIFDIPLLFESKLTWMVDRTVLIYVAPVIQLQRLMSRNGYTEEEASVRIRSQIPIEEKKELADEIIDNSGTREETAKQLEQWLTRLRLDS